MRLLFIVHNQSFSGPFNKIYELCDAISKTGDEVVLLCTSKSSHFFFKRTRNQKISIWESPDLFWGKLRQGLDLWNTLMRIIYLSRQDFDLIHAIDCRPVVIFPALFMKYFKGVPLILSWWDLFGRGGTINERSGKFYSLTIGKIEEVFEEYFRKFADKATVISELLFQRLVSLGYPREKIELHRLGTNIPEIKLSKTDIKLKYGFPANKKILCYAGSLFDSDKIFLLESLRELKTKIDLPLTIIIGNCDFANKKELEELSILSIGRLNSNYEFFQVLFASDYALIPMKASIANKARWPSKTTDYWAAGLPVIATPISDYEILFPKFNLGWISDDNPKCFAETIFSALNTSIEEYRIKHESVLNYVINELDWKVLIPKLKTFYNSVL